MEIANPFAWSGVLDFMTLTSQTQLTWYGQAAFKIVTPGGNVLLIDPWLTNPKNPNGKAFLKGTDYQQPHEMPDEAYPLWLTTGRLVYHFHTRTKTGRSKELMDAAPDSYVQISEEDALKYGIREGDMVEIKSVYV